MMILEKEGSCYEKAALFTFVYEKEYPANTLW